MNKTRIIFTLGLLVIFCGCSEREELAKRLAEEKNVSDAKAPPAVSEFHEAALRGDTDFVRNALERRINVNAIDEEGRSALQLASFDGHHEIVGLLLEKSADVDHTDLMGRTALMFASTASNIEAVNLLIKAGASIDAVDKDEQFTALMYAAAEGQLEVVESLLRAGADPDLKDEDGETARDFAASKGHAKVASLLETVVTQAP